jgi:nickel/cobalt exporter
MELAYTIPAVIGLGALHALEPGHGKGVITAYLVATRGKIKDALLIGVISAITHTISIVCLSLLASTAIHGLAPEHITHWIELIAGILIILIGAKILYGHYYPQMLSMGKISQLHDPHFADHDHHDHHHHHHHHSHETPNSLYRLIVVGFFTGIIPCPSAVAIFLAAMTAEQIPLGLELVSAFSLGSAITMSAIGIMVVQVGSTVKNRKKVSFIRSLNVLSSVLIMGIGLFVTLQSIGYFI